MSDETTPSPDLRDQIAALFRHAPDEPRPGDETPGEIADLVLGVVRSELDRRDAEIARLGVAVTKLRERDDRMTELTANHVSSLAKDLRAQQEWADQLYTAWWSARIGRAMARLTLDRTRDALSEAIVEEQELLHAAKAERDQLKATLSRVRKRAEQWAALAPADDWGDTTTDTLTADHGRAILADLNQPAESKET